MKKYMNFLFLIIPALLSSCDNGKAMRDFYLSQPKDQRLIGVWKQINTGSLEEYGADGWIYGYHYPPSGRYRRSECWYTENDSIISCYFYSSSLLYGSRELWTMKYRIIGDTLHTKSDNDSYRLNFTPSSVRVKLQSLEKGE